MLPKPGPFQHVSGLCECGSTLTVSGFDFVPGEQDPVVTYACTRDCVPVDPLLYQSKHLQVVAFSLHAFDHYSLKFLKLPGHIESALYAAGMKTISDVIIEINAGRFHLYPNTGPIALSVVLKALREQGYDVDEAAYEY